MKLHKVLLTIFSASAIFLSGCQKELSLPEEPVLPSDPTTPADTAAYLEKIYSIDSLAGVSDTVQYTLFEFDASKRVIQQTIYKEGLLASWYNYYYSGANILPSSSRQIDVEGGAATALKNDTLQTFYFYTAAGLNDRDSIILNIHSVNGSQNIYQVQKTINRYEYGSGKIFRNTSRQILYSSVSISSSTSNSVDTAEIDSRGNILTHKHYSIVSSGASQFNYFYTYTYDNKPSPLSRLNILRTMDPFSTSGNNNRQKIHYEFLGGTLDEDLSGRYVYKTNGYPSRLAFPSGTSFYHIESYWYKQF